MLKEPVDYRYGFEYGWDSSHVRPKEKDLLVITTDRKDELGQPQKNKVVRLVDDAAHRQTIGVTNDLVNGHGVHIRLGRRDVRPLSSRDELIVSDSL